MIPVVFDFSTVTQALDVITSHAKLAGLLVGAGAAASTAVHWWIGNRALKKGTFRRRILFLATRFEEPESGPVEVHFKPIGDEHELTEVVGIPALENRIAHATRHAKNGLLCLRDGASHKRMMHIFERWIQGNDPIGNSDWIMKRPTHDDVFAFMPAYYREDDVSMIFVFVVDADEVGKLKSAAFRARMTAAAKDHHEESVGMVKLMGEQMLTSSQESETTALVRFTEVTTARANGEAKAA